MIAGARYDGRLARECFGLLIASLCLASCAVDRTGSDSITFRAHVVDEFEAFDAAVEPCPEPAHVEEAAPQTNVDSAVMRPPRDESELAPDATLPADVDAQVPTISEDAGAQTEDALADAAAIDMCPDDANKSRPGACGCASSDVDSDGDSVADCEDGCPTDPKKTAPGLCGCGMADRGRCAKVR